MNGVRWFLCAATLVAPVLAFAQDGPVVPGAYRLMHADTPDNTGAGLVLISELMCAACHELPDAVRESITWEPKRLRSLSVATPGYLRSLIASPSTAKPGTTMPKHDLPDDVVEQLAQFVSSLSDSSASPSTGGSVERGADLYHTVGCVACHAPRREPGPSSVDDDPFASTVTVEYPKPSIPSIAIRENLNGVDRILMASPSSRMPHLKLGSDEASSIAAYLASESEDVAPSPSPSPTDGTGRAQGKEAFAKIGCVQCHTDAEPNTEHERAVIEQRDRGCLAETVSAPAVDYGLTDAQRSAIRDALAMDTPRTDASWRVLGMAAANNCLACHQRDGYGGVEPGRDPYFTTTVDADLGDEGRIPPTLSGVGAKLTPSALKSVLTGHGDARPYMATRMPVFDLGDVDALVEAFAEADRDTVDAEVNVTGLEHHHRNRYGRELMGTDAFGCVSCHELNGHRSLGIPAIDLALSPGRLRPEWFMAYLRDPASLRPGTRMPAYFPEGTSTYPGLFKGNARQQIEAIWIYLREIDQTRLPVGMEDSTQYVLAPRDTPVVHRTFMKDVGSRAIAVGFPEGIHFAFDATQVRSSLAWRGDFLDATSTWNDRFSPYVEPLSDDRWHFPGMMPFAAEENADAAWPTETGTNAGYRFKGFRLDDSGTPEFRYLYRDLTIGERITPLPDSKGLRRTFTIENVRAPVRFLLAHGARITPVDDEYRVDEKWTTRISVDEGEMNVTGRSDEMMSLVATFTPVDGRIVFVQEIEW